VGLINDHNWAEHLAKQERMKKLHELLEKTRVPETAISYQLSAVGESDVTVQMLKEAKISGTTLAQLLKRPEMQIEMLAPILRQLMPEFFNRVDSALRMGDGETPTELPSTIHHPLSTVVRNELKAVETEIKYSGYLDQQTKAIERLKKSEQRTIPDWFDYAKVSGLSREMNEKLTRVRPRTLGQASRIPGVTPAAVSLINVYIEIQGRQQASAAPIA
jgi:tRNA uridine 5-carboxymethylaminomethyl modification enzyme